MTGKHGLGLGLALLFSAASAAPAQTPLPPGGRSYIQLMPTQYTGVPSAGAPVVQMPGPEGTTAGNAPSTGQDGSYFESRSRISEGQPQNEPEPSAEEPAWGPTPLDKVGILQKLLFGDGADKAKLKVSGWMDFDYTFRSTGPGQNNVAPVMNRFGDEFLTRTLGIWLSKPLDPKELSWGFNAIFIGGADAAFIGPTAGGWANPNPRFGSSFTDLNVTAHLPILTEGGVDIKAGRQSTVLGTQGALPWARVFDSSDYAWYNLEEGRYTGISANWIISKQLSWYNGIEIGGWGVFYDNPTHGVDYITQINYWLDEEAKKTHVWTTVLTGPTGFFSNGNTTTVEVGFHHNWNKYFWTIVDYQMTYSKAPLFFPVPPSYQQRAYDIYTYNGYHLTKTLDVNSRLEWYKDVDGGGYPGGFIVPHTDYFATTLGVDYHPVKWMQFRPEIRYDYATHPAFGENNNLKNQLSIAAELLIKF